MTRAIEVVLMTLGGVWQGIRQDFNLFEILLVAVGLWLWRSGRFPRWKWHWPDVKRAWGWAIALALGTVAVRIALLPVLHAPVPVVSDEFSHLLLADTLLHGRAANPTHPYWQFFETLHVIQQPHYGSDYFPGHAAVLAAWIWIAHAAWAGILFECALFLVILFWMLRGWMPARWALLGVALAAVRFGIGSYWVNAFHGGFLPAAGGALIAGAFPRLLRRSSFVDGAWMGVGFAILVVTRPFEGALYSLPFVAMLIWKSRWRDLIPAVAIAGAAAGVVGIYFDRVTGSPLVTAYQVNQKAYGWPMGLAWTKPPKIEFRDVELRRYYEYELGEREKVDGPVDFVEYLTFRVQEYWRFFLGPVLTVPLIMIGRVWRRRRLLIIGMAGALFAILLEGAASPHYLAPATAVLIAIIVECMRHMEAARVRIVPVVFAVMAVVLGLRIVAQNAGLPYTQELNYQSWCCKQQGNMNKARIARDLAQVPGEHLVFVKTKASEFNLLQWIYNSANIDGARIVWARDLGEDRDAELAKYYRDRDVWVVDPNVEPATVVKGNEILAKR